MHKLFIRNTDQTILQQQQLKSGYLFNANMAKMSEKYDLA
jgi:hypothetical protein